jgi:hypothetical protein
VWLGWYDFTQSFQYEHRARLILSNGTRDPIFGATGFLLATTLFTSERPELVAAEDGHVMGSWIRSGAIADSLLGAQRLSPDGGPATGWPSGGIHYDGTPAPFAHAAIADGGGGAIAAWREAQGGGVRMLRIDGTGAVAAGWPTSSVPVGHAASGASPVIASDGSGGAIAAWADSIVPGQPTDLFARHVDADGTPSPLGAAEVCTAAGAQSRYRIAEDGAGGAFVAWQDERDDAGDVYLRRIPREILTASVPGTIAGGRALQLGRPSPNPAHGAVHVTFELGRASSVRTEHAAATRRIVRVK